MATKQELQELQQRVNKVLDEKEKEIARLSKQIDSRQAELRDIQSELNKLKDARSTLTKDVAILKGESTSTGKPSDGKETNADKLLAYLQECGDEGATKNEIHHYTGINANSLNALLSTTEGVIKSEDTRQDDWAQRATKIYFHEDFA